MFEKSIGNQTIALAGIYQSCLTVSNIAWKGTYVEEDFNPLISSVLKINSKDITDIYIGLKHLKPGFMYLRKQLVGDIFTRSGETRRYFASLIELSKKLQSDSEVSSQIQELLNQLNDSHQKIELTTDDLVSELSNIYTKTLSKFEPRIIVNGENTYLTTPLQASRIRTALFAGLRSVFLWQQSGGSKLKMFFFQSRIAKKIDEFLKY